MELKNNEIFSIKNHSGSSKVTRDNPKNLTIISIC